jgi:hypothetical protein
MTSLMKFLAITAAVLFTTTNAANAWYSSGANSSKVDSFTVILSDDAENACWTNLRQAREYAEEKLEIEGYNVLAEGGEYNFEIRVLSERNNSGGCYGYVMVNIWANNYRNGVFGGHEIGVASSVYVNHDNLNIAVIEVISTMVGQM